MKKLLENYFKEHTRRLVMTVIALLIWAGLSVFMNGYEGGDEYAYDDDGQKIVEAGFSKVFAHDHCCPSDMQQYMVHNRWPKWTPFYQERYGIIDMNTGEYSKPLYADELRFMDDGYAWDYEGHYVDREGNIIVTNRYYLENDRWLENPIKSSLVILGDDLDVIDMDRYISSLLYMKNEDNSKVTGYPYSGCFSHGLSPYRARAYKYAKPGLELHWGYIDMNGNMVIEPQFDEARIFDENGYARVAIPRDAEGYENIQYTLITPDYVTTHEYAVEPDDYEQIHYKGAFYGFYKYGNSGDVADLYMDVDGNFKKDKWSEND